MDEDNVLQRIGAIKNWARGKGKVDELTLLVELETLKRIYIRESGPKRLDYRQNIIDRLDRQTEKGIKKYGQLLSENKKLTDLDMLEYLAEELTDGLVYIEDLKQRLERAVEEEENEERCL